MGFRDYGIERVVENSSFVSASVWEASFVAADFFVESLFERYFTGEGRKEGWRMSEPAPLQPDTMFGWHTDPDTEVPGSEELPSFVSEKIALRRRLYNDRNKHPDVLVGTTFLAERGDAEHHCFIRCVCFDRWEIAGLLGMTIEDARGPSSEVKLWSCGCGEAQPLLDDISNALIAASVRFFMVQVNQP